MSEEKQTLKNSLFPTIILVVAVFIVCGLIFILQIPSVQDEQYLQKKIDNTYGISREYRMGWEDCITALHNWKYRVTNITTSEEYEMSIIPYTGDLTNDRKMIIKPVHWEER